MSFRRYLFLSLFAIIGLAMFWSQSAHVVWQVGRTITYRYLRHKTENKVKDTISIPLHEKGRLIWLEDDEVSFDGRMFDVSSRWEHDGVLTFAGRFDETETRLFDWLDVLEDDEDPKEKKQKHKVRYWSFEACIYAGDLLVYTPAPCLNSYAPVSFRFPSSLTRTDDPPPKAAS